MSKTTPHTTRAGIRSRKLSAPHLLLALIVVVYLAVGGLYAVFTPPWQSPDEPAHYNYVRQIAARGGCCPVIEIGDWQQAYQEELMSARFAPALLSGLETLQYEDHQPPLYYLLARAWTPQPERSLLVQMRLFSVPIGAGVVLCAFGVGWLLLPERPQVALAMAALVAFLPQHVHMLASVNNDGLAELIVGLTLAAIIYYLQDRPSYILYPVISAALMLAIWAAVAILGAMVYDPARDGATGANLLAMAAAVGMLAAAVYWGYNWLKHPEKRRLFIRPWSLGLLVGLGLVTKVSTLLLVGIVPAAILLKWWLDRRSRKTAAAVHIPAQAARRGGLAVWRYRDTALGRAAISAARRALPGMLRSRLRPLLPLLRGWAVFALPVIALGGLWALRNISVYGFPDVFGLGRHDLVVAEQLRTADLIADIGLSAYLGQALRTTFTSFWGQFGWMAAPMPGWIYGFILALLALAGSGWVLAAVSWRRKAGRVQPAGGPAWRAAAYLVLALTAALALLAYVYYNTSFVQYQGRYLYPALIPLALALAVGVDAWRQAIFARARSAHPYLAYITLLPFLAFAPLDLYLLWRWIIPALTP